MRFGNLRHHIELHRPTYVIADDGQQTPTWVRDRTAWAEIRGETAAEYTQAGRVDGVRRWTVAMRYHPDEPGTNWRVYWPARDRTLQIEGVLTDGTSGRTMFVLRCAELREGE